MSHTTKSKIKTCLEYKIDLTVFTSTGRINDEYIDHLDICNSCLKEMQNSVLKDLKALENKRI